MEISLDNVYIYLLSSLIGVGGFYILFAPAWLINKGFVAYWLGGFIVDKKTSYVRKALIFLAQYVFLFVVILITHFLYVRPK